ncbi:MAG: flagellar filament capping protein FliD [Oceanococcaceae bacterium]
MPGISSAGIGSGLDIQGLVSQLVAADRAPAAGRLQRQESETRVAITAFGQLRSAMSSLQSALSGQTGTAATEARTLTQSADTFFSASAETGSALGNYSIIVEQLATTGRSVLQTPTDPAAGLGLGTLDLTLGADSFSVEITDANTTLAQLRDAINNAADNPGVRASIINVDGGSVLSLSSDRIGADSAITLGGVGDMATLAADFAATATGQDARITIDGMPRSSPTNTISDAIDGVTLNLTQADPATAVTLGIARNDSAISDAINAFVTAYNAFATRADQLGEYNPVTGNGGPLNGNALLRGVESRIKAVISEGQGPEANLLGGDFGLRFDANGQLSLDAAQLQEALSERRTDVAAWWSGDTGLASRLDSTLGDLLDNDASLKNRELSLEANLQRIDDRRDKLDARMERAEARYLKQFTALDIALAQMQSTSSYLASQLASLNSGNF